MWNIYFTKQKSWEVTYHIYHIRIHFTARDQTTRKINSKLVYNCRHKICCNFIFGYGINIKIIMQVCFKWYIHFQVIKRHPPNLRTCTNLRGPCLATDMCRIFIYLCLLWYDKFWLILPYYFIFYTIYFSWPIVHLPCTLLKYIFFKKKKKRKKFLKQLRKTTFSWETRRYNHNLEFISSETIFRKWMWNKNIF